jgi:hydroxymethylbilane synthase
LSALRLGTRGSALALAQARWVAERLEPEVELVEVTTAGDLRRDVGDKSRWTGALERALVAREVDLVVHSAKDVPGELADGTEIAAVPVRADARDVLVGAPSLAALAPGARVGTSALRRRAQVLAVRPDVNVVEVRGNVDTRLRKLADGEVEALVLAAAGLERLGRADVTAAALEGDVFVPAPGQGCLLVQGREGDASVAGAIRAGGATATADGIDDVASRLALETERDVAALLGASCHTAVGIHAALAFEGVVVRGFVGLPDGSEWLIDEVRSDADDVDLAAMGAELAERMLAAGAADLLERAA